MWPPERSRSPKYSTCVSARSPAQPAASISGTLGGLLRCGFAGWGLLLVEDIVRNSGGREHPLPRRVHDDVPCGEVRRISLPRTQVNKGKKRKGRGCSKPRPSFYAPLLTAAVGVVVLAATASRGMLAIILRVDNVAATEAPAYPLLVATKISPSWASRYH